MKILIIASSPNKDGLTAACVNSAYEGVRLAGGAPEEIWLNDLNVGACEACEHGWGTCRIAHVCQTVDDFQDVHSRVLEADAYILVTPVYWGEMSESMKSFTDRLRRCEATRDKDSSLAHRPVIAVAAAGGSGNGMLTCLASLERWVEHVRARKFDFIPVNRWSRRYKLAAIRAAGRAIASEIQSE